MKTTVLFNPKANNGKGEAEAKKLIDLLKDKELDFMDITKINSYEEFFKSLSSDDEIIICGGDGTLNCFINDTYVFKIVNDVYYYPTGSGNDFYHDVHGGDDKELVKINEYFVDLPTVKVKDKTYRFLNGVGYGIDGYCCEEGDKQRDASDKPVNYTSIAIKGLLFHYKPVNAVVTVDGKEYKFGKVWLAPTMNGRMYGGGMIPTPDQKRISDDKKLTVMIMSGSGKIPTLIAFPKIFEGKHVDKKMTTVLEGKKIKVEFDRPTALQIDGETVLGVTEYEAEV
ncbi:MAG: diacylglycerol kinase family protein [Ruminococcus sp.]|nr:diacylglycerol kinase family protein [Ruminococcus sp.]